MTQNTLKKGSKSRLQNVPRLRKSRAGRPVFCKIHVYPTKLLGAKICNP